MILRSNQNTSRYALDADATSKLTSIMARREMVLGCDIDTDLQDLDQHLGASRRPSAFISMKLNNVLTLDI